MTILVTVDGKKFVVPVTVVSTEAEKASAIILTMMSEKSFCYPSAVSVGSQVVCSTSRT